MSRMAEYAYEQEQQENLSGSDIFDAQQWEATMNQIPASEPSRESWNRCNVCGKFIPFKDFDSGAATRVLITPDSDYSIEEYDTLCKLHAAQPIPLWAKENRRILNEFEALQDAIRGKQG